MIGRPNKDEAAEFHWTYIDKVSSDNAVVVMEQQVEKIAELLVGISEEQSLYRYAPGKWSIRESMGHVTDTERMFAGRALWFARGLPDALPDFDQEVAAFGAEANRVRLADHLEEFRQVRASTLRCSATCQKLRGCEPGLQAGRVFPFGRLRSSWPGTWSII